MHSSAQHILTKKVVYVLKALYYLEIVRRNQRTSVLEIAGRLEIPKRFLEQLFLRLRKAGILQASRGAAGGYRLIRPLREISLAELLQALSDKEETTEEGADLFGEGRFVDRVGDELSAAVGGIRLGTLVTAEMRRRALAGDGTDYIYQI